MLFLLLLAVIVLLAVALLSLTAKKQARELRQKRGTESKDK